MKTIVIYNSQTGFTKQYAQWLAEAAGADCLALSEAEDKNMDAYEAIVFGAGHAREASAKSAGLKRTWINGRISG